MKREPERRTVYIGVSLLSHEVLRAILYSVVIYLGLALGRRPELKSEKLSFVHYLCTRYQGVNTYSQHMKCYR